MKSFAVLVFAIMQMHALPAAQAQTMYRCGSNYQDKPCANGQTAKVVSTLRSATPRSEGETVVTIDASCKRRGGDAQKIIWAREGGAQRKDLLAKADSEEQAQLISDIYAVRGNSNEVRANIEKDCMAEKDLGKRLGYVPDAALLKAAKDLQQKLSGMEKPDAAKKEAAIEAEAPPAKKTQTCAMLKLQLEIVSTNARTGADTQNTQTLNQQKRELEKEMAAKGCRN